MSKVIDLQEIRAAMAALGALWQPADNPALETLSLEDLQRMYATGVNEDWVRNRLPGIAQQAEPNVVDVVEQTLNALIPIAARVSPLAAARPSKVDWRDYNGVNCVTQIKDQGSCGSCVGFCITGLLESMVGREHFLTVDLSEADLYFCGGAICPDGWNPDEAINRVISTGVSLDRCFPYPVPAADTPCAICPESAGQRIRATRKTVFYNAESRKQYLSHVGPMAAVMDVYDDFYAYAGGIYSHLTGDHRGAHCVEVIGYDDDNSCWICKNSWGTIWGDSGFFRIAYGQCGIDSDSHILWIPTGSPFWGISNTLLSELYKLRYWIGPFQGETASNLLVYKPTDYTWWIGEFAGDQLHWIPAGNTEGFGNIADGRPFWIGNFSDAGKTDILFYYPDDDNWWLGTFAGTELTWSLAGNTARFGHAINDGRPFWIGDFNGDGRDDVLFYYPGDYMWWDGRVGGGQLQWTPMGKPSEVRTFG